jgi:hypothetical protein
MPRFARITVSQAPQRTWHHGIYLHFFYVTFYVLDFFMICRTLDSEKLCKPMPAFEFVM